MSRLTSRGATLFELVTVLAVMVILAGIVVPGAASAGRMLAGAGAAQRLALVLRAAQARAQSHNCRVDVTVGQTGAYDVRQQDDVAIVDRGDLGVAPATNYPGASVSFNATGSPCLFATATPRAGNFSFGATAGRTVVVQLGGCIRCR